MLYGSKRVWCGVGLDELFDDTDESDKSVERKMGTMESSSGENTGYGQEVEEVPLYENCACDLDRIGWTMRMRRKKTSRRTMLQ